jgi:hypothetical protein
LDSDKSELPWVSVAEALEDASFEEDPPPFDLLSGSGLGKQARDKIPLEEAENLLLLRAAAADARLDRIGRAEFLVRVQQVARVAVNGIKLFNNPGFRAFYDDLPPEQIAVFEVFEDQVYSLKEATDLMARYADSGAIEDLDEGLAMAERCMAAVDKAQDRAGEFAAEYRP